MRSESIGSCGDPSTLQSDSRHTRRENHQGSPGRCVGQSIDRRGFAGTVRSPMGRACGVVSAPASAPAFTLRVVSPCSAAFRTDPSGSNHRRRSSSRSGSLLRGTDEARLLSDTIWPRPLLFGVEPLFAPGREEEIAASVGLALAHAQPVPDTVFLDSLPQGSSLPALIGKGWPRPHPEVISTHSFPWSHVHLEDGGFDGWLQRRSAKFRQHFRYDYRKVQAAGFEHKVSVDAHDISDRLLDFRRLYEARRASRDGAGPAFDDRFQAVVAEAADRLSGTGRLRLATIEKPGEVIAADLIVSAGGHASLWYTGFDDAWAHLSPIQCARCCPFNTRHTLATQFMTSAPVPMRTRPG